MIPDWEMSEARQGGGGWGGGGGDSEEYTVMPGNEKSSAQELHCKSGRGKLERVNQGGLCDKYKYMTYFNGVFAQENSSSERQV